MKSCNLDCEFQEEGICIGNLILKNFNPDECKAKTNDDLLSWEECEELGIGDI